MSGIASPCGGSWCAGTISRIPIALSISIAFSAYCQKSGNTAVYSKLISYFDSDLNHILRFNYERIIVVPPINYINFPCIRAYNMTLQYRALSTQTEASEFTSSVTQAQSQSKSSLVGSSIRA